MGSNTAFKLAFYSLSLARMTLQIKKINKQKIFGIPYSIFAELRAFLKKLKKSFLKLKKKECGRNF